MNDFQIGKILYNEQLNEDGELKNSSLFFIDEESDPGEKMLPVVWIAQMEDYGSGIEVDTHPIAGMVSAKFITRTATDEDILSFVSVIKNAEGSPEKIRRWMDILETSEDCSTLLPEEKQRLVNLHRSN